MTASAVEDDLTVQINRRLDIDRSAKVDVIDLVELHIKTGERLEVMKQKCRSWGITPRVLPLKKSDDPKQKTLWCSRILAKENSLLSKYELRIVGTFQEDLMIRLSANVFLKSL